MFILFDFLISAAVLTLVLMLVGKVNLSSDFMRPFAVIIYTIIIGVIAGFLLGGVAWGIPQLLITVAALYFLIGYFFDLTTKKRGQVVAAYFGLRIAIGFLFL